MMEEICERLGVAADDFRPSTYGLGPNRTKLTLRSKRSKIERYVDILRVVRDYGPIKRTHILYRANLSWADLGDSLDRLERAGTLRRVAPNRGVYYEITEGGLEFLSELAQLGTSRALARVSAPQAPALNRSV